MTEYRTKAGDEIAGALSYGPSKTCSMVFGTTVSGSEDTRDCKMIVMEHREKVVFVNMECEVV